MRVNPVFIKELKIKARSWRFPIGITVFILFIMSFMLMVLSEMLFGYNVHWGIKLERFSGMYLFLFMFLMVIISIIVPSTASNAICGEKSKRTFDLLLASKLKSLTIVIGKLMATISHTMLLLTVSMPFFALFFVVGVVNSKSIGLLIVYYMVYALLCGSVGLFYSSICKGAVTSTIATYVTGLTLTLFNALFVLIMNVHIGKYDILDNLLLFLIYINPLTGFSTIIEMQYNDIIIKNVIESLSTTYSATRVLGYNIMMTVFVSLILIALTTYFISPFRRTQRRK